MQLSVSRHVPYLPLRLRLPQRHGDGIGGGGWHGGWHGGGWGWPGAVAAGVVGGAVAAATSPLWAPGYYDYAPGYAYGPDYSYDYDYAPAPYVASGPVVAQNDDASYCASRFRSYDPASGTYLGFDGRRHSCP